MSTDHVPGECMVNVRTVELGSFTVQVPSDQNGVVGVIKARLEELTGVAANRQRLLHRGREVLETEEDSPDSLGWGGTVVLHMVTRSAPRAQRQTAGTQGTTPPSGGVPAGDIPQPIFDMLNSMAGATGGRMTVEQITDAGDFGRMVSQMMSGDSQVAEPIGGALLSGRVPPLNEDGTLRLGSSYDVLHQMLRRLEGDDMEEDEVPSMQETSLEMFRNEQHSRAFAAAVVSFLSSCRDILRGCTLNRETREVVNRALRAAGQGTLPLGVEVESFPVGDVDDARDANDYSWLQNVSHEDLIIVSAVTIGELARRYLAVLHGGNDSLSGINVTIGRLAERLRSLSSVTNQEETIAQIRLVAGHLSRVAVTGAEMGRSMAYLTAALENNNMFFLQLYPGYIEMQNGIPRPHLGILHNMEAHRVIRMVPDIAPGIMPPTGSIAGIMSVQVPLPMGTGPEGTDGNAREGETNQNTENTRRNEQGAPVAPPNTMEGILRSIPQVDQILSSFGGAQGSGNLSGIFSNALRNITASNVNVDQILNEIKDAITQGLSAAATQIRSVSSNETPSLDQMMSAAVPEITNRVGTVLRSRIASVINSAGEHEATPPAEAPSAGPAAAPTNQAGENAAQTEGPSAEAEGPSAQNEESVEEKNKEADQGQASIPKKAAGPVMGLGGGLKKRKVNEKAGPSGAPNLPPRPSRTSAKPNAPSRSSMQSVRGQSTGGSNAGASSNPGGGMDFGALLNSAGPLLGQIMGGGSGRTREQEKPLDVEEILERDIPSPEERAKWRQHLQQPRPNTSSSGEHSLGETYLASIPPHSGGNGFLDGIL